MKATELSGVIVPVITPVDAEDRVDEAALRKHIRSLIAAGVDGIFAGGSAGEGPLLTMREWERMLGIAFEECQGRVHLLGGVMDTSTKRVAERIRILAGIGYGYFVVTPTFYISVQHADEHLRLFGNCKENSCGMEMIAYNIPSCTGSRIAVATMFEMARRGWIRYCKESSEDADYFYLLISDAQAAGLKVLHGGESFAAAALLYGACGMVPAGANFEPQTYVRAYQAAQRHDMVELWRCQQRIHALRQNLLREPRNWLGGLKYALSTRGVGSGKPVSPLQPLDEEERNRIDNFLRQDAREMRQDV